MHRDKCARKKEEMYVGNKKYVEAKVKTAMLEDEDSVARCGKIRCTVTAATRRAHKMTKEVDSHKTGSVDVKCYKTSGQFKDTVAKKTKENKEVTHKIS